MIGILDWGIGGLFALQALRRRQPTADVVYLSDAGNTPYGRQSRRELARSVDRGLGVLRDHGATQILVACHSASTVLPLLAAPDAVGVIAPEHVPRGGRIAVLGGVRTVRSQVWRRALVGHGTVVQRIAQPLSAAVEAGALDSARTRELVRRLLEPVKQADTVVLACTHYTAVAPLIAECTPGARLVDPALARAETLELPPGSGGALALTTGDPQSVNAVLEKMTGMGAVDQVVWFVRL